MKNIIKMLWITVLAAALIVFSITSCNDDPDDTPAKWNGRTHYANTSDFTRAFSGQQVWEPNNETGRFSNVYLLYEGADTLDITVFFPSENSESGYDMESVGSGEIKSGKLYLDIDEQDLTAGLVEAENLLQFLSLRYFDADYISDPDTYSSLITIDSEGEVKGNYITIFTDDYTEALDRENLLGTRDSLSMENILFLYVDKDCSIKLDEEIKSDDSNHRYYAFDLSLHAGWNIVCKKVTHGLVGRESSTSIEIKNPDFKWVKLSSGF